MGSVGDRFDNAVIESFWGRMQTELLNRKRWNTRVELASAMFEYVEVFHNRERRHSSIGMLTPIEYENLPNTCGPDDRERVALQRWCDCEAVTHLSVVTLGSSVRIIVTLAARTQINNRVDPSPPMFAKAPSSSPATGHNAPITINTMLDTASHPIHLAKTSLWKIVIAAPNKNKASPQFITDPNSTASI